MHLAEESLTCCCCRRCCRRCWLSLAVAATPSVIRFPQGFPRRFSRSRNSPNSPNSSNKFSHMQRAFARYWSALDRAGTHVTIFTRRSTPLALSRRLASLYSHAAWAVYQRHHDGGAFCRQDERPHSGRDIRVIVVYRILLFRAQNSETSRIYQNCGILKSLARTFSSYLPIFVISFLNPIVETESDSYEWRISIKWRKR